MSCELKETCHWFDKTEILHTLESNPKINQSSLPNSFPVWRSMLTCILFFTLCQNIVGSHTPFIKNWWHLKGDRLTFICVFSVQCTLHLFKKHYKTPNGGNNLQWNFVLMNLSKPANLSKCPTVQLKNKTKEMTRKKLNHKAEICINITL